MLSSTREFNINPYGLRQVASMHAQDVNIEARSRNSARD